MYFAFEKGRVIERCLRRGVSDQFDSRSTSFYVANLPRFAGQNSINMAWNHAEVLGGGVALKSPNFFYFYFFLFFHRRGGLEVVGGQTCMLPPNALYIHSTRFKYLIIINSYILTNTITVTNMI